MADNAGLTDEERAELEQLRAEKEAREQALAEVEHEHGRAARLAHRAHRVGGADVSRPLLADVLVEEHRGDDEPPRDGSQKEADDEQANRD